MPRTVRLALPALLAVLVGISALGAPSTAVAAETEPWQQVVDITFPTLPQAHLTDTFDACRSGCTRHHQAADLIGEQMWPLYAVTDGTVCSIDEGEEDSWGRHLTICGDDGNRYRYLHLNNDTPGTDDGQATLDQVYAPGIRKGVRVGRGQLVAYMGDSGNAEETVTHLHFDVYVPGVTNPWGEERINPYPSLVDALAREDIPDGTFIATEPMSRWAGRDRVETAVAVSAATYDDARTVVLATSLTPQEALVAGPLAAALDAPVLITAPGELAPAVATEIDRLGADHAVLVGDLLPSTDQLVEQLGPEGRVERVDGGDVFATAALVAERVWDLTGAMGADPVTELLAGPLDDLLVDTPSDTDGTTDTTDGTTAVTEPDTAPEYAAPTLLVSQTPDRTTPAGTLDGATVPTDVAEMFVWLDGVVSADVDHVAFRIDHTDGHADHVEHQSPYDLAGTRDDDSPRPWPIGSLDPGEHTVTATIVATDGSRTEVTATFRIADDRPRRAIVALGRAADPSRAWPDALAAAWYGSVRGMPVLLTAPDGLPAPTAEALATVQDVWLSGGTAAIPATQADEIVDLVSGQLHRLFGADRFETAQAIAEDLLGRDLVDPSQLVLATGHNWPDAVTAAPAVAARGETFLLVHGTVKGTRATRRAVTGVAEKATSVVGLGGTAAITNEVLREVAAWAA